LLLLREEERNKEEKKHTGETPVIHMAETAMLQEKP
jgi:hypothetical protein